MAALAPGREAVGVGPGEGVVVAVEDVDRGTVLSPMPARTATAPAAWSEVADSPNAIQPAAAPTSGSRFRNAPAIAGVTRDWP